MVSFVDVLITTANCLSYLVACMGGAMLLYDNPIDLGVWPSSF